MASRRLLRKILVSIGGALLFVLAFIGVVLPIMPGFVFLIAGLILLSREFEWAERALAKARSWLAARRTDPGTSRSAAGDGAGVNASESDTSGSEAPQMGEH